MTSGVRRARVQSYEHELGDWYRIPPTRVRRAPDVRLSGLLLDRELLGYQHSRAQFTSWLEPPRGGYSHSSKTRAGGLTERR